MLETIPDDGLRVYVVWVPMVGGTVADVPAAMRRVPDPRARHFWDGTGATLQSFRAPIALREEAWDLYLLYGATTHWAGEAPPTPDAWEHQLRTPDPARLLDPARLAATTRRLLAARRARPQ